MERAEISSAVHEPNSGYCRGEIKQARPSVRRCEQARREGTINEHVLSPSVRGASAHGSIGRGPRAEDVTDVAGALGCGSQFQDDSDRFRMIKVVPAAG